MKYPEWEDFKSVKLKADDARGLLGKQIWYLRNYDIDKSGRGYFWPRTFYPVRYERRHLWDELGNCLGTSEIVRLYVPPHKRGK